MRVDTAFKHSKPKYDLNELSKYYTLDKHNENINYRDKRLPPASIQYTKIRYKNNKFNDAHYRKSDVIVLKPELDKDLYEKQLPLCPHNKREYWHYKTGNIKISPTDIEKGIGDRNRSNIYLQPDMVNKTYFRQNAGTIQSF